MSFVAAPGEAAPAATGVSTTWSTWVPSSRSWIRSDVQSAGRELDVAARGVPGPVLPAPAGDAAGVAVLEVHEERVRRSDPIHAAPRRASGNRRTAPRPSRSSASRPRRGAAPTRGRRRRREPRTPLRRGSQARPPGRPALTPPCPPSAPCSRRPPTVGDALPLPDEAVRGGQVDDDLSGRTLGRGGGVAARVPPP